MIIILMPLHFLRTRFLQALSEPSAAAIQAQLPNSCRPLSDQLALTDWLADPLCRMAPGPGKVPLSLAHKTVCGSLLAPLAVRLLLQGNLPELDPERLAFDDEHWYADDGKQSKDPLAALLMLVQQINHRFHELKLPPRIIYSNTAIYLALPWTRLGMTITQPAPLLAPAQQWLTLFGEDYAHALEWRLFAWPDRTLLLPHRRDCCLRYKVCDGQLCGTCNRYSVTEMKQNLRQWLDTSPS